MTIKIIGAGLAGSEAAWQLAENGHNVTLYEMRPEKNTPAHKTGTFAELVCSNSLRGAALSNAVGLLKEELRILSSLIMKAADTTQVPAGGALAVDRNKFSEFIQSEIEKHPNITVVREEITALPEYSPAEPVLIATGPLTSDAFTEEIKRITGQKGLSFYDAISPVITVESIDFDIAFYQSRYDKGDGKDYINIPLNQEQYFSFIEAVKAAEKFDLHAHLDESEELRPFEGCMPIEDMIERGDNTLRFGPFKPKGLTNPHSEEKPYAVLQLRHENQERTLCNMVGMQTRMRRPYQKEIFQNLPGLEKAEFMRYGSVHRNTFINSPELLSPFLEFKKHPGLFIAGQITGVEGYVESTACGLIAALNISKTLSGEAPEPLPSETATGSLINYITSSESHDFQPMNINFGIISAYHQIPKIRHVGKKERREQCSQTALEAITQFVNKY